MVLKFGEMEAIILNKDIEKIIKKQEEKAKAKEAKAMELLLKERQQ